MLVVRFKIHCKPGTTERVVAVLTDVIEPSRRLDGVINFDVARALDDPDALIATEVFEDRAALDRQEATLEVGKALAVLEECLRAAPEATIYHVSASEPHGE